MSQTQDGPAAQDPWSADGTAFLGPGAWLRDSCTATSGGELEVRSALDGSKIASLEGASAVLSWSPDRAHVVTRDGCAGGWDRVWDAKTWRIWDEVVSSGASWSNDGRFLYAPNGSDLLTIRVADRVRIHQLVILGEARALPFTDDGRYDGEPDDLGHVAYRVGANVRTDPVLDAKDMHDIGACPGLRDRFFRGEALGCERAAPP